MKYFINLYINKIKKEPYQVDSRIPDTYLMNMGIKRVLMLIRGYLSMVKKEGVFFVGSNVTIKSRTLIKLGKGVTFDDDSYVDGLSLNGIQMGNNVSVGKRTVVECTGNLKFIGVGLSVGNNVGLGTDSFYGCAGGITIGSDTIVGNYVSFHSENHNFSDRTTPIRLQGVNHKGIIIENDCWIGAKATVLDGAHIGQGCIITAGAVVRAGTYEPFGIYGGVPAKLLKMR